jgi:hypothetical protein
MHFVYFNQLKFNRFALKLFHHLFYLIAILIFSIIYLELSKYITVQIHGSQGWLKYNHHKYSHI